VPVQSASPPQLSSQSFGHEPGVSVPAQVPLLLQPGAAISDRCWVRESPAANKTGTSSAITTRLKRLCIHLPSH
jgi:hypothetical protein